MEEYPELTRKEILDIVEAVELDYFIDNNEAS